MNFFLFLSLILALTLQLDPCNSNHDCSFGQICQKQICLQETIDDLPDIQLYINSQNPVKQQESLEILPDINFGSTKKQNKNIRSAIIQSNTQDNIDNKKWQKLLGVGGRQAEQFINREEPSLTTFLIPDNYRVIDDYQRNRVRIFVNGQNIVTRVPIVG